MDAGRRDQNLDAPDYRRLDEPAGLFLGAVASPQSRPPLHPVPQVTNSQIQLRSRWNRTQHFFYSQSLEAIFAYERTLFKKHGKKQRAAYTWRKVRNEGIIASVEAIVLGEKETLGFRALAEEGMLDMAFESVILKHPEVFSKEAVERSRGRLDEWKSNAAG